MSVAVTSNASDPITGSFSVALGGFCDAVSINPAVDNLATITNKLRTLPYMNGAAAPRWGAAACARTCHFVDFVLARLR